MAMQMKPSSRSTGYAAIRQLSGRQWIVALVDPARPFHFQWFVGFLFRVFFLASSTMRARRGGPRLAPMNTTAWSGSPRCLRVPLESDSRSALHPSFLFLFECERLVSETPILDLKWWLDWSNDITYWAVDSDVCIQPIIFFFNFDLDLIVFDFMSSCSFVWSVAIVPGRAVAGRRGKRKRRRWRGWRQGRPRKWKWPRETNGKERRSPRKASGRRGPRGPRARDLAAAASHPRCAAASSPRPLKGNRISALCSSTVDWLLLGLIQFENLGGWEGWLCIFLEIVLGSRINCWIV